MAERTNVILKINTHKRSYGGVKNSGWNSILDCCLIYEIFSSTKLAKTEELRNTTSIPKSLLPDYQRLLSSMPSRRLNTSKLIDNS
ncbi:kinase family with ARM repeat domain-containing protein, partial [Thalictrum thalictroides]